jgi:hypothetical protein
MPHSPDGDRPIAPFTGCPGDPVADLLERGAAGMDQTSSGSTWTWRAAIDASIVPRSLDLGDGWHERRLDVVDARRGRHPHGRGTLRRFERAIATTSPISPPWISLLIAVVNPAICLPVIFGGSASARVGDQVHERGSLVRQGVPQGRPDVGGRLDAHGVDAHRACHSGVVDLRGVRREAWQSFNEHLQSTCESRVWSGPRSGDRQRGSEQHHNERPGQR